MPEKNQYVFRFERKVRKAMEDHHMLGRSSVLCAVSGGADSVSLLMALRSLSEEMGFSLSAVHVEHGIRGRESLDDCEYVRQLCAKIKVPLTVRHIRVLKLAEESGRTVEEEARIWRYRIFRETAVKTGADRVAVAHNMGDQAETVIFNLVRGSGLRGLAGIRCVRPLEEGGPAGDILIIRPLLGISRQEIEQYLSSLGCGFRTDRTNLDTEITRNRIRADIIPELESLNRQAKAHIFEAARQAAEAEDFLERMAEDAARTCIRGDELLLSEFCALDPVIRKRILRECIKRAVPGGSLKDISRVHVGDLEKLARAEEGKRLCLPGHVRAVREKETIRFLSPESYFGPRPGGQASPGTSSGELPSGLFCPPDRPQGAEYASVEVPFEGEKKISFEGFTCTLTCGTAPGKVERIRGGEADGAGRADGTCQADGAGKADEAAERTASGEDLLLIPEKRFTKWIAYATIDPNHNHVLCFRSRRPGDFIVIDREGRKKKLSNYLTDRKVPREKRDQVVLLAEGSRVLWAVGGRISEDAKVKPGDRYVKAECSWEEDHERRSQCIDSGREGRGEDPATGG